jgi:hypothetical protein
VKDLTAWLTPDLTLNLGGRTYTVRPPTVEMGLNLTALNVAGVAGYLAVQGACPTCGRTEPLEITDDINTRYEALKDTPLGVLSLGQDVYEQMVTDALPEKHIDTAALYAMYYWTMGEKTADKILESMNAAQSSGVGGTPKASKNGHSTASGPPTRTASTRTTASRKTSSQPTPSRPKAPTSGGPTSSTTGP